MSSTKYPKEVSQAQMARLLGVSSRTLRDLDFPSRKRGRSRLYEVGPTFARWVEHREEVVRSELGGDQLDARERRAIAEAELAEIRVAEARGRLIPVHRATAVLERIVESLRARVQAIPGSWGPVLVAYDEVPDMVDALDERARELLDVMREELLEELEA